MSLDGVVAVYVRKVDGFLYLGVKRGRGTVGVKEQKSERKNVYKIYIMHIQGVSANADQNFSPKLRIARKSLDTVLLFNEVHSGKYNLVFN